MPAPLPESRRAEVMRRLEDGTTVTEVARQLGIGRQTVTRYRAAAREQQAAVPKPRSMGGYRSSKVKRAQIVQLSTLATENPKRTLVEIRELAEADGMTHVSLSTICLLYTSPSPRDGLLSRMPSSA